MKIFSGTANKPLAESVALALGLNLSPLEIYTFPDKEKRVRILDSVLGVDTVVIQPTATPGNEYYLELFLMIDALKRSGAKSITAVIPYFGYQRQDHIFRDGEGVSLEMVITLLQALKVDKVISFDFHAERIPELFNIPVTPLSALSLFAEQIKQEKLDTADAVLVSPDMGGIRRIKILAELLNNMDYVVLEKDRDLATGEVTTASLDGNIKSKRQAILVDDMISSGGTLIAATNLLLKKNIDKVYVFATHAVFAQGAPEVLQKSALARVFVTDTIRVRTSRQFPKLTILSIAKQLANEIKQSCQ